jgi:hypothetical protein
MDITISKKATFNTGNYSSITPSVSLTFKDVDIDKVSETYEDLNVISAVFFLSEYRVMADLQDETKKLGITKFFETIDSEREEMKSDFINAIKRLAEKI